jgi:hypothetical protein
LLRLIKYCLFEVIHRLLGLHMFQEKRIFLNIRFS